MPRRNRVDPWGDLSAEPGRGMFTGNRGCLVDDTREIVRHHNGNLWITCVTSFRDWRHPLDQPRVWTPLFFLDDAVALAAGHRPCAFCRPDAYASYQAALASALGLGARLGAAELNKRLAAERLRSGRGLRRAADRLLWEAPVDDLPDGAVFLEREVARLVMGDNTVAFSFDGWIDRQVRARRAIVEVLTPPTSVAALRGGFLPQLHASA